MALFVTVPAHIKKQVIHALNDHGLTHVSIGNFSLSPAGIKAENIRFHEQGIDRIQKLWIDMDWLSLQARRVQIDGGEIAVLVQNPLDLFMLSKKLSPSAPRNIPWVIRNSHVDLSTPVGIYRVSIEATLSAPDSDGLQKITATVETAQYEIGFESLWEGIISPEGVIRLNGDIQGGHVKAGPAQMNRATGWINIVLPAGSHYPEIQTDIESGSGKIFDIPLQDIRVIFSHGRDNIQWITRARLTALENAYLSLDGDLSPPEHEMSHIVLKIPEAESFFSHVETVYKKEGRSFIMPPASLKGMKDVTLFVGLQPERRFQGGPLPFEMRLSAGANDKLRGNILLYHNDLTLRGTAQGDEETIQDLATWIQLSPQKVGSDFLRLDQDLKGWMSPSD
ncbi:MAG: hypothetical protein J0L77_03565 [Alphaproteobacteria bacterium]|nr:hypothetical protein [Alphaproteobacteria bacterium]